MTALAWPQASQAHCSGVQTITRSTRGKPAGSSCRPGCWRLFGCCFSGAGRGSRWLSAWTSASLTPGSVLLDPLQPQPLFQYLDLQFGPGKFLLQLDDLLRLG